MSLDKQKGARDAGKREAAQTEQPIIGEYLSFAATEAYKLLRTNLMFALPDQGKCRVVGVTSALRNEGKSTLAINLAYTVAQAGYRVLLIDGDMRLPTLAKRLNIPKRPGLSNLLAGLCTVQDAVQTSDLLDNLKAIAAGDIPPNPSELLASARMETLLRELGADYGIHGEGEEPLAELIGALERGRTEIDIPSVYTRDGRRGSGRRSYLPSIEVQFEPELTGYYWKRSGMLNIQTKRGCPYDCIYCSYPSIDGRCVRTMDPEAIAENILRAKRDYGISYLFFTDSVFNIGPEYNVRLAETLIRRRTDIRWGAYFSPRGIDAEQMRLFRASGLTHIEFGTESFCDRTLEAYGKRFTFGDVERASRLALDEGVYYAHFLILGGYGDTRENVRETIENSRRMEYTVMFPYAGMRIYPHTRLAELAAKEGAIGRDDDLMAPSYYISRDFDLEEVRRAALATGKAWVFPDDPQSALADTLRLKRNKKGPLWEYLRKP